MNQFFDVAQVAARCALSGGPVAVRAVVRFIAVVGTRDDVTSFGTLARQEKEIGGVLPGRTLMALHKFV